MVSGMTSLLLQVDLHGEGTFIIALPGSEIKRLPQRRAFRMLDGKAAFSGLQRVPERI